MAFWIFKCNPDKYRLGDRLRDWNPQITWTVSRYRDEIGPGDTAFLWETGKTRGIRAVMRVDEVPSEMDELVSEQKYWVSGPPSNTDTGKQWRVLGTLTYRDLDLSHTKLREISELENLSVFKGFQQQTNFAVTPEEGAVLLRLIG